MLKFDVLIPVRYEHIEQLLVNLDFIFKNLPVKKVKIICKKSLFKSLPIENFKIDFLDEDSVFTFNYDTIEKIIKNRGVNTNRAGWYFQQFLKMEYCFFCDENYYLVWDADTIPLTKITFFSEDGQKMLFNRKEEHHLPYFETMDMLFNKTLIHQTESFISEGMIIDCKIMKEMIRFIDNNKNIEGDNWVEKIIYAIPAHELVLAGFSEFETYGNYLINKYPNKYKTRTLKTLRLGMKRYGRILTHKELLMINNYDTISFENWNRPIGIIDKLKCYYWLAKLYLNKVI